MGRKIPLSEWLQTVGQNEVNNYAELVGAVQIHYLQLMINIAIVG